MICCLALMSSKLTLAVIDEGLVLDAMAEPGRLASDIERDNRSIPQAVIPLLKLQTGDTVVDLFAGGGYYSELMARVIGSEGTAILHNSLGFEAWGINGLNDRFAGDRAPSNIQRHTRNGVNLMLTDESIDAALIVMAIHDLYVIPKRYDGERYVRSGNPANSSYFLEQVFAALKPGGRFVVVDHQGNPDSGLEAITDLHRLDEIFIRSEIESHGFMLVDSSDVLRNPNDDRDRIVFDEDLQGRTDRFVLAFEKPSVPQFELDPLWPHLPLGDNWLTGGLGGMCIDSRDHIFLLNRQNIVIDDLDGARLAPPIIELDPEGVVVRGWGDLAMIGARLHDCHVDSDGNLWLVAAATGYVQKWTADGSELLMQIGETDRYDSSDGTRRGTPLNSDSAQFFLPAAIDIDKVSGEIYVADGELPGGNSRIAVFDQEGNFLRQWRLQRTAGEDAIELPHCLRLSNDGLVYVCDRRADRIQVFDQQGNLVRTINAMFTPLTSPEGRTSGMRGSAVVLAFSPDPDQQFMYVINQNSVMVDIYRRTSGELLGSFGGGPGRYRGQFELPHGIGVDSKGNVYVEEQEGRRIQKYRLVE